MRRVDRNMLDSRRWLLLLLALCLLSRGAWAEEAILQIRLGIHTDATRIVLDLAEPTAYRVGLLASPNRVYIELPAAALPAALPQGRGLVQGLSFSSDSGLLRLVAVLKEPVTVTNADLIPGSGGALSRRLVVDVTPASGPDFAAALGNGPIDSNPPIVIGGAEAAGIPTVAQTAAEAPAQGSLLSAVDSSSAVPALRPGTVNKLSAGLGSSTYTVPAGTSAVLQASTTSTVAPLASSSSAVLATTIWPSTVPSLRPGSASAAALPLIYIDPGHGGPDPGTIGTTGTYEKDVTLAMAKELQRQLLATGRYRVKMTRDTDKFVALRPRFEMARRDHADMFISLHADANPFFAARGATVYTLSETASDSEAEALAAKENKADLIDGVDLSQQNNTVTSILIDLAQRETKNRSAAFAELLVHDMGQVTLMLRNSHRFAGFAVLKAPDIPSVLIELGYLSDAQDEALLISPLHRTKLAGAMLRAIDGYYAEMASGTRS
jgi:N-acetylmuramoyl-L-alanine amidase